MKKSKILMPLTGIAAIGAIAPVAVMTACNKGTSTGTIFTAIAAKNEGLFGADLVQSGGTLTLPVRATVKKDLVAGHVVKHSWAEQTSANGLLKVGVQTPAKVQGTLVAGDTWDGSMTINVGTFTTREKDETLKLVVKYEEYESEKEGAKVVATQEVTYNITAFATKVSFPVISFTTPKTLTGKCDANKKVLFGGLVASKAPEAATTISVSYSGEAWTLDSSDTAGYKLTIPAKGECSIAADKSIQFEGTEAWAAATRTTSDVKYTIAKGDGFTATFTLSTTSDKYVKSSWTQEVEIPEETVFTISQAA